MDLNAHASLVFLSHATNVAVRSGLFYTDAPNRNPSDDPVPILFDAPLHSIPIRVCIYDWRFDDARISVAAWPTLDVDQWIESWNAKGLARPVVGRKGKSRRRAPSTVENSVIQLRAALAAANRRGDTLSPPKFRAVQPAKVNNSPRWRASVTEMAAMMSYAMQGGTRTRALHRFLVASIATLARPDAVIDMSTDPARGQWRSGLKTFELNPSGRIQTKKYRPTVGVPRLLMGWLESTNGYFVRNEKGRVSSVQAAWSTMRNELGLPQECTTKSIRRSMATLLRSMHVPLDQLEMQMGHRSLNATTQIYAPDDPDYLADSLKAIETIMDQIEALAPGVFTGLAPEAINTSDRPASPSP